MRWLAIFNALLDLLDIVFYVAVGDKNVRPTIEIVIEEKAGEAQREQAGTSNFRTGRFIHKQAVTFSVIERHHLVGEIGNDEAGTSRMIVVTGIDAHAGARDSIFAKGNAGLHPALGEG